MKGLFSTKPLSELSLDELNRQARSLKTVGWVVGGVTLASLVYYLIHLYQAGSSSGGSGSMAGFAALAAITASRLRQINAEIAARPNKL